MSSTSLDEVIADVSRSYPKIEHIDADQLINMQDTMLIDTRSIEEYRLSHLAGALWAEDLSSLLQLLEKNGATPANIVLYCSVGMRSSHLAQQLKQQKIIAKNLRGGIFAWANQGRPLEGSSQVHPYDETWGLLLLPKVRAGKEELKSSTSLPANPEAAPPP